MVMKKKINLMHHAASKAELMHTNILNSEKHHKTIIYRYTFQKKRLLPTQEYFSILP